MDEARTQLQEEKYLFYTKIKQTNKNFPVGEKQTGRLAGLDWLDWTRQALRFLL